MGTRPCRLPAASIKYCLAEIDALSLTAYAGTVTRQTHILRKYVHHSRTKSPDEQWCTVPKYSVNVRLPGTGPPSWPGARIRPAGLSDGFISQAIAEPGRLVVAGWGAHGTLRRRAGEVTRILAAAGVTIWCLGTTRRRRVGPLQPFVAA
jgi:hypothetical protein